MYILNILYVCDRKISNLHEVIVETINVAAVTTATSNCSSAASTISPTENFEKFIGVDFKRLQQKMFFFLTISSLLRFISDNVVVFEGTSDKERLLVTEV